MQMRVEKQTGGSRLPLQWLEGRQVILGQGLHTFIWRGLDIQRWEYILWWRKLALRVILYLFIIFLGFHVKIGRMG